MEWGEIIMGKLFYMTRSGKYSSAYEDACRQAGVYNPAEWSVLKDQEVDRAMEQACSTHWYHLLSCKANYGKASRLWWQLFKKYNRLQEMEKDSTKRERKKGRFSSPAPPPRVIRSIYFRSK